MTLARSENKSDTSKKPLDLNAKFIMPRADNILRGTAFLLFLFKNHKLAKNIPKPIFNNIAKFLVAPSFSDKLFCPASSDRRLYEESEDGVWKSYRCVNTKRINMAPIFYHNDSILFALKTGELDFLGITENNWLNFFLMNHFSLEADTTFFTLINIIHALNKYSETTNIAAIKNSHQENGEKDLNILKNNLFLHLNVITDQQQIAMHDDNFLRTFIKQLPDLKLPIQKKQSNIKTNHWLNLFALCVEYLWIDLKIINGDYHNCMFTGLQRFLVMGYLAQRYELMKKAPLLYNRNLKESFVSFCLAFSAATFSLVCDSKIISDEFSAVTIFALKWFFEFLQSYLLFNSPRARVDRILTINNLFNINFLLPATLSIISGYALFDCVTKNFDHSFLNFVFLSFSIIASTVLNLGVSAKIAADAKHQKMVQDKFFRTPPTIETFFRPRVEKPKTNWLDIALKGAAFLFILTISPSYQPAVLFYLAVNTLFSFYYPQTFTDEPYVLKNQALSHQVKF